MHTVGVCSNQDFKAEYNLLLRKTSNHHISRCRINTMFFSSCYACAAENDQMQKPVSTQRATD